MPLENCWEIRKCGRHKNKAKAIGGVCPACPERGHTCWMVTDTLCNGEPQGTFPQKQKECLQCEVYKRYNPHLGTERNQAIKECSSEFMQSLNMTPEYLSEKTLWIATTWNKDVLKVFNEPLSKRLNKYIQEILKSGKSAAEARGKKSKSKSGFLGSVSSEVSTPLNGIINLAERTLDTELTPEQRENLTKLKVTAKCLLSTVNGFFQEHSKAILK